ncbi:MAG: hypothetical protein ABWZ79_04205 [Pedobacter agri]
MRLLLPMKNRDRNDEDKTSVVAGMMFRQSFIARAYFTTVAILFFTNEIASPDGELEEAMTKRKLNSNVSDKQIILLSTLSWF